MPSSLTTVVPRPRYALVALALYVLPATGCAPGPTEPVRRDDTGGTVDVTSSTRAPRAAGTTSPVAPVPDPPAPAPATPPFISSTRWSPTPFGPSLEITPTPAGRRADGVTDADLAWEEVRALEPDADDPGMRAQFLCHWEFARLLRPDKPTWNIEPWRPQVDDVTMMTTGCNPGGPEI